MRLTLITLLSLFISTIAFSQENPSKKATLDQTKLTELVEQYRMKIMQDTSLAIHEQYETVHRLEMELEIAKEHPEMLPSIEERYGLNGKEAPQPQMAQMQLLSGPRMKQSKALPFEYEANSDPAIEAENYRNAKKAWIAANPEEYERIKKAQSKKQ